MSDSDEELMLCVRGACRARRDEAFRTLVRRHKDFVMATVRAVLAKAEGAEDVTQEVFLRVYAARERYAPGPVPFRMWLHTIARNAALNARRSRSRREARRLDEAEDVRAGLPDPGQALERRLDLESVRRAVQRLRESEQALVALRFDEGLSYAEIEKTMGRGAAALRQKAFRALERLRELLGAKKAS